jgi:signal transduction histidine kinase
MRMRRQAERLTRLVADLLDVSRLRTGHFALEPAPTDGLELVKEVVDRMRADPAYGARLEAEVPDTPFHGVWDGQRIEQVLTNLIENAFRYSYEGTPVRVVVRPGPERVRISILDQGIGIPADSLGNLFQPFFRAHNASTKHAGGLGLGLSICREIAERHGGRVWAESDGPGKGSRFHLELPSQSPSESSQALTV